MLNFSGPGGAQDIIRQNWGYIRSDEFKAIGRDATLIPVVSNPDQDDTEDFQTIYAAAKLLFVQSSVISNWIARKYVRSELIKARNSKGFWSMITHVSLSECRDYQRKLATSPSPRMRGETIRDEHGEEWAPARTAMELHGLTKSRIDHAVRKQLVRTLPRQFGEIMMVNLADCAKEALRPVGSKAEKAQKSGWARTKEAMKKRSAMQIEAGFGVGEDSRRRIEAFRAAELNREACHVAEIYALEAAGGTLDG